jgi:hypothetical protein
MINYESLLSSHNTSSADELYQFFWNEVASVWIKEYTSSFPKHGEIFQQTFEGQSGYVCILPSYL